MASVVTICNSALQKIGARRIAVFGENSPSGRACEDCYETQRDAELRAHVWNFAKKRASLAADSPAPSWGRANSFTLPSDFLRLYKPYPEQNSLDVDYEIEGGKILSNFTAPLQIRYIAKITDTTLMDPLFREALATRMAIQMCEALTQSNVKKNTLREEYIFVMREARRVNALERTPDLTPEDEWITVRR